MSRFPQRLYIRQSLSELFRHVICRLVCRHTHRLGVVLYDIVNKLLVHVLAKDDSNGRIFVRLTLEAVKDAQIPLQLSEV